MAGLRACFSATNGYLYSWGGFATPLQPKSSQGHVSLGVADGKDYVVSVTFKSSNFDNVVLDNVTTGAGLR